MFDVVIHQILIFHVSLAFVWPESSHQFVHSLYDLGFERLTLPYNPFFFITGNNHHYGREQVEVYSYRLPGHPTDPCDTNPNLVGLFPPTVTVPSRNGDGSTEEVPNPALLAAGLPRETDAAVVVGLLHLGIFATGPPGYGHGGMLASIADVVQFLAYAQTGRRAVTGQLNMTYRSPVPLGHVHVFVASVELTGERKGNTRFTILSQDLKTIHLESTAVFITPRSALGASLKQTAKDYENAYQKS